MALFHIQGKAACHAAKCIQDAGRFRADGHISVTDCFPARCRARRIRAAGSSSSRNSNAYTEPSRDLPDAGASRDPRPPEIPCYPPPESEIAFISARRPGSSAATSFASEKSFSEIVKFPNILARIPSVEAGADREPRNQRAERRGDPTVVVDGTAAVVFEILDAFRVRAPASSNVYSMLTPSMGSCSNPLTSSGGLIPRIS